MKFLFDLLPVILFFAAYKIGGANPDAAHALAAQRLPGLERHKIPSPAPEGGSGILYTLVCFAPRIKGNPCSGA